jgi:hypothetical protein
MNKKPNGKRRTRIVEWPKTSFFMIEDIFVLNPTQKQITLRTDLTREIDAGKIVELGCKTGGKGRQGRPKKVFAYLPVSKATLDIVKALDVTLVDSSRLQKISSTPVVSTSTLFGHNKEYSIA